jgi:hypoxanthine phosphoribosyltransferase
VALAEVMFTAEQIENRVRELGVVLREDMAGEKPVLISVLKGSVIFLADLVRALGIDVDIDFMSISAYQGAAGGAGVVKIVKDLEEPIEDRHVVVVEDIVDTGLTLSYLLRTLETRGPKTLKVCALVDKAVRRIAALDVDHAGFECEEFLVGYGLDFQGRYRNLPYLMSVNNVAALAADPGGLEWIFRSRQRGR